MQNRRKFLIQGSLVAGAAALLKPLESFSKVLSYAGVKSHESITILHTSDLFIAEHSSILSNEAATITSNLTTIGNKVKALRSSNPNTLLLHNGNISTNTTMAEPSIFNLMEEVGYDALVAGNKEQHELTNTNFAVVDSLNNDLSFNKGLTYHIVKKGNIKIGIISNSSKNHYSIEAKSKALSDIASQLKNNQRCNLVVCLSTNNTIGNSKAVKNDIELASLSSNVDLIISGNNIINRPINYVHKNMLNEEVMVHATTINGSSVGRIEIEFNEKLEKKQIKASYKS